MERDLEWLQRLKRISNVDLGTAGHAYMYIWKAQINEFINEVQDLFAGRPHPRDIRTLVESVNDDINRAVPAILTCPSCTVRANYW